jgi:hypothetical protein
MGASPKRRCIFCDEHAKLTKEHLWSKWTRQLVQRDSLKHEYAIQVFNIDGIDRTVKTIAGDARSRGLRAVCEKCNSGWMGSIEEWAKPSLVPLIKGTGAFLNRDNQRAIATWIAMKAMVGEYFDLTKVAIPLSERQFMRDNRCAPDANWKIWIGNYERTKWLGQYAHGAMGIAPSVRAKDRKPEIPNTQVTTFVIGKLYAHVFSSEIARLVSRFSLCQRAIGKLAGVWPLQEDFIAWPTNAMDDADADAMASAIFLSLKSRYPYPPPSP